MAEVTTTPAPDATKSNLVTYCGIAVAASVLFCVTFSVWTTHPTASKMTPELAASIDADYAELQERKAAKAAGVDHQPVDARSDRQKCYDAMDAANDAIHSSDTYTAQKKTTAMLRACNP